VIRIAFYQQHSNIKTLQNTIEIIDCSSRVYT